MTQGRTREGLWGIRNQQAYDAVVHPWERERYLERG